MSPPAVSSPAISVTISIDSKVLMAIVAAVLSYYRHWLSF
jgi:hypothetical protein